MLYTFGALHWQGLTSDPIQLGAGKPLALLAYLICHPGWVTRDELVDLLWSNLPPERGRHALRQTLHSLRRLIGSDTLESTTRTIRLRTPCPNDRTDFLTAFHEERNGNALAVYRGSFLAGIAFPGGSAFEDWRDLEATRLRRMWESASDGEIRRLWRDAGPTEALELALGLRRIDATSATIRGLLIETHLQLGNIQFARSEADELTHLLREQGVEPSPPLGELLARVSGSADLTARSVRRDPLDEPELVGRAGEFATLLAAWQRAQGGTPALVHVEGEAGLGKSRLMAALSERLAVLGATAVTTRAYYGERTQPFAAIATLVEHLANLRGAPAIDRSTAEFLVRLLPRLRQRFPGVGPVPDTVPEPIYLTNALIDLIHAVADEGRIAILADDVHWYDHHSVGVLAGAAARLGSARIMLVTAGRGPTPLHGADSVRVRLSALDTEAVRELVSHFGELDSTLQMELVSALTEGAHGHPLLIMESLRLLLRLGTLQLTHGRWTKGTLGGIAEALSTTPPISSLLRGLDGHAAALLRRISIAGQPLPREVLGHGFPPGELTTALQRLEHAGLIRDTGLGWEITHDLMAEHLLGTGSAQDNHAAHQALAHGWLGVEERTRRDGLIAAARHAAACSDMELLAVIGRQWYELARREGRRISGRQAIRELAHRAGVRDRAADLLAGLRWHQRHASTIRSMVVAAGAVLLVVGATRSTATPEAALRLEREPLLGWSDPAREDAFAFIEPFRVVAQRPDGTPDSAARGAVSLHVVNGNASLAGPTSALLTDGVARLDSVLIRPDGDSAVTLQVRSADGKVVATRTFWTSRGEDVAVLRLVGGRLNGKDISPDRPVVSIRPGEELVGHLEVRFRTDWLAAAVMLCGITTWQRGDAGSTALSPLPTPVQDGRIAPTMRIAGPTAPGRYRLILAARAEAGCHWIGSRTNWEVRVPSWNDGYDIADLTGEELALAQARGVIRLPMHNKLGLTPASYGIQSIEIVVQP